MHRRASGRSKTAAARRRALGRLLAAALALGAAGCAGLRRAWNSGMDNNCANSIAHFKAIQRDPHRYLGTPQVFNGDVGETRVVAGETIMHLLINEPSGRYQLSPHDYIVVVAPRAFDVPLAAGDKNVSVLGRIGDSVSGDESFGPKVDAFALRLTALKNGDRVWVEPGREAELARWQNCL